jgi:hypothetical protein
VSLKPSSRARLRRRHLAEFAGDTLFDAIGRAACEAECLPRKELYECWEVARRVRQRVHGRPIVDLAAGHGVLAWMLLLLDREAPSALCVDRRRPDSSHALEASFVARWPRLAGHVAWEVRDLEGVTTSSEHLVVSVHACGRLTDRVIDIALAARAPVAVLPCCQSIARCETAGLDAWLEGRLAIDVVRAMRLREAGYSVKLQHIPAAITPQNRLIVARPA